MALSKISIFNPCRFGWIRYQRSYKYKWRNWEIYKLFFQKLMQITGWFDVETPIELILIMGRTSGDRFEAAIL